MGIVLDVSQPASQIYPDSPADNQYIDLGKSRLDNVLVELDRTRRMKSL